MNIPEWIEANRPMFTSLSDEIWGYAELGYKEFNSSKTIEDALEEAGFTLERGVAEIPTAFVARYGRGGPVIGILGEFDALPGLSQDCVPYRKPLENGAPGHGCGHNLLGVAGLASVMAIKQAIDAGEAKGSIVYYGCPAEEGGAGKAFMANAGVFNDADICLTWHPDTFNGTWYANFLSNYRVTFKFRGKTAHAAADPFNGRSALDAVELMNVGVNYLREHMIPDARVHYVTIHGGGMAPNVVPDFAESLYSVRAPRTDQLDPLFERVKDIARGAALMTGTEVEITVISGMSNMLPNDTVNEVLQAKLHEVGAPKFTEEEHAFARELSKSIPADSLETGAYVYGLTSKDVAALKDKVLYEEILPPNKSEVILPGSTDVGDVSWVVPTGQIFTTCWALGSPGHSWQIVAQGKMGIGQRGMLYAGKVMALAALEFMQNDGVRDKAIAEFRQKRAAAKYISPIPVGTKPPLSIG